MDEKNGYEHGMQYIIETSNDVAAAKDIRLYNMKVWLSKRYNKYMEGLLKWYRRYTAKLFGVSAVDSGMSLIREGVVYLYLLYLVFNGDITVAGFVLYFNVVAGFSTWLGSLLGQINVLSRLNISMNRFRSYLEYPESYKREEGKAIKDTQNPGAIEMKNVSFRYSDDGAYIIKDFNLNINPGEHLAVVGLNGAGKTTFIKLLCRLYDPTEGEILLNGKNIREYDYKDYLNVFSFVFQDFKLLAFPLGENIAADTEPDEEKASDCAGKASLSERVENMPDGLKTYLYKDVSEKGVQISGGEAQKIALARALYKDSPIIVLDEPTAALDPKAEEEVFKNFSTITEDKTAIYISHRLSSCRFCDEITVFDKGEIVQKGDHGSLLKDTFGKYAELWNAQAKYYQNA